MHSAPGDRIRSFLADSGQLAGLGRLMWPIFIALVPYPRDENCLIVERNEHGAFGDYCSLMSLGPRTNLHPLPPSTGFCGHVSLLAWPVSAKASLSQGSTNFGD